MVKRRRTFNWCANFYEKPSYWVTMLLYKGELPETETVILSVHKFTASLYCTCLIVDLLFTSADAVQIT